MPVAHREGAAWRVRFRVGGHHRQESFDTEAEALRFCADIANRGAATAWEWLLSGSQTTTPTLDAWAERHFDSLTGVTAGTLVTYRRTYARVWSAPLGGTPLGLLTREQVGRALRTVPGSDKTVRNAWGVLTGIVRGALAEGIIARNPCAGIRLPRRSEHERREHRYLSVGELRDLLDALPPYWRPLVWTLAGTGCRWGEAVALEVGDVSLAAATLRIARAEKWDPSRARREIGPTKTRRSRRTVTLPPEVVEALAPLVEGRPSRETLFLGPRGAPVRHRSFWSDVWLPSCARAGLEPRPRIHDLRHSHVAWLVAAGVPLPVIQARLGHESITTTIDTYGHLLPDLQRAAADAASRVLSGVRRPSLSPAARPAGGAGTAGPGRTGTDPPAPR